MSYYLESKTTPTGHEWVRYHYEGNREVVDNRSAESYHSPEEALDTGVEWMQENGVDAELVFPPDQR